MKYVPYYRVSTKDQGDSGLGLDAQRKAVRDFTHGASLRSFTEVESGKTAARPELVKAMALAKRAGATLVVAKLDRLSRNVAFLSALMESGVQFVCCDNPNANRLTLHILVAVAEEEARLISERTRKALAALKDRGVKLGGARPECRGNLSREAAKRGRKVGAERMRAKAIEAYADLLPEIQRRRTAGESFAAIAAALNADGHTTRTGAAWTKTQVFYVLGRVPSKS